MTASILDGAEPFYREGNDLAVLVLHGFTGTTQSMRFFGDQLHRRHGLTVSAPRLAGHGTSPDDMEKTGYLDWLATAEQALHDLKRRRKRVYVAGLSMGGTLALNLAARFESQLLGTIAINAVASILSPELSLLLTDKAAPARLPGIGSDIKAEGVTELAYDEAPLACLKEVFLLASITHSLLPLIERPVQIMQSRVDHVVPPHNASIICSRVSSSDVRLLWLNDSYHVATLDNDRDMIVERTAQFIASLEPQGGRLGTNLAGVGLAIS